MSDRVQTSLWLRKELKHIVDNENLNLTEFVNKCLEKYFSVTNVEEIDNKIADKRREIEALEKRRADLLAKVGEESREEKIAGKVWDELTEKYADRMESPGGHGDNEIWITNPKNAGLCKILGKRPLEVLEELEAWYDTKKR